MSQRYVLTEDKGREPVGAGDEGGKARSLWCMGVLEPVEDMSWKELGPKRLGNKISGIVRVRKQGWLHQDKGGLVSLTGTHTRVDTLC